MRRKRPKVDQRVVKIGNNIGFYSSWLFPIHHSLNSWLPHSQIVLPHLCFSAWPNPTFSFRSSLPLHSTIWPSNYVGSGGFPCLARTRQTQVLNQNTLVTLPGLFFPCYLNSYLNFKTKLIKVLSLHISYKCFCYCTYPGNPLYTSWWLVF